MGFLAGRRILVTGMLSNRSIAYGIARACAREGAALAFTYQGEAVRERVIGLAAEFADSPVLPCDVASDEQVEAVGTRSDVIKASVRDLLPVLARGGCGSTTVASTSAIAAACGIDVFATGGLGGVHRQARDSWDESADLTTLASTPITIVCSGVKSILDVPATLERMETLSITVVGYRTSRFPGFYLADSGYDVPWQAHGPEEVADLMRVRSSVGIASALVVANPVHVSSQLDPDVHDAVLAEGLAMAADRGISGKDVTPFLLDHFHRATHGRSLAVNSELIVNNAELAARIAVAARS